MKRTKWIAFLILGFLAACADHRKTPVAVNGNPEFIRVSPTYPRYFETSGGSPWIPVMINYIVPNGEEPEVFNTMETYFKHFSEHGGNSMRIWISSPFLEIEDRIVGEYSQAKLSRIDTLLRLAEEYQIRIKFTLQHIRNIQPDGQGVAAWSNRAFMSVENGGPFEGIGGYINTREGKAAYLERARVLSGRYKNNSHIFSWELWNEMDAVDAEDWFPFSVEILDSVKALFPDQLVAQTLGSLHSPDADVRYEKFLTLTGNEYITVHRYLDPGTDWGQYDRVRGPMDLVVSDAVQSVYRPEIVKPVVANEHGAVEPNHTGPSKLYPEDSVGILIHDMIFAPFFCGASGCGALWHWNAYVEEQDLWYHYGRFNTAIRGIDPVAEAFSPFAFAQDSVRCYGIKGRNTTLIWCRDARNNWMTELQQGIPPEAREGFIMVLPRSVGTGYSKAEVYDPWKDRWTKAGIKDQGVALPPFLRSAVVKLK